MKTLLITLAIITISGCGGFDMLTPYGKIKKDSNSQIFTYTDADVTINKDSVKSDDTTVIIVGVTDNSGTDISSVLTHSMTQIKEIFKARQKVYEKWLNGGIND